MYYVQFSDGTIYHKCQTAQECVDFLHDCCLYRNGDFYYFRKKLYIRCPAVDFADLVVMLLQR